MGVSPRSASRPVRIYETVLYASEVATTAAFYSDTLGLRAVEPPDELSAAFRLDDGGVLLLFDPARSSAPGRPVPSHGATGDGHVAFGVAAGDLDRADRGRSVAGLITRCTPASRAGAALGNPTAQLGHCLELLLERRVELQEDVFDTERRQLLDVFDPLVEGADEQGAVAPGSVVQPGCAAENHRQSERIAAGGGGRFAEQIEVAPQRLQVVPVGV